VNAGRLEIRGRAADQDAGCERRVFDPTHVIEGIECSDDRVLAARRDAYSVSIERRLAARQKSSGRSDPA
jgi:catalase